MTGSWRVRVIPKAEVGIPNFIVIGKSKVQGKVVYSLKANIRVLQCANCFSEDHKMNSPLCTGIRDWNEHCLEFEKKKESAKTFESVMEESVTGEGEDMEKNEEDVRVLMTEVEERKMENENLKIKIRDLEEKSIC